MSLPKVPDSPQPPPAYSLEGDARQKAPAPSGFAAFANPLTASPAAPRPPGKKLMLFFADERGEPYSDGPGYGTQFCVNSYCHRRKLFREVKRSDDVRRGLSLGRHVVDAYQWLMRHYKPGDRIYLFGASSGGYTACVLASMVHALGIIWGGYGSIEDVYEKFVFGGPAFQEYFRKSFSYPPDSEAVHFIGLFDPIIPLGHQWDKIFCPSAAGSLATHYRVASALDERRSRFLRWPELGVYGGNKSTLQVFFAGSHYDVSGGEFVNRNTDRPSLSFLSLRWMIREALEQGLELTLDRVYASPVFELLWRPAQAALRAGDPALLNLPNFGHPRRLPASPAFHFSVQTRLATPTWQFPSSSDRKVDEGEEYLLRARFAKGEGMENVRRVE
ncbi:hypothetical protein JCM6882_003965 [Rhodosporidiobolus microsporus]